MSLLISFVDENGWQFINLDTKVHEFIDHDKEWNLHSITTLFPSNVLADIKAVPIPSSPLENSIFFRVSLKMVGSLSSQQRGQ